jgi:hypothetical protein
VRAQQIKANLVVCDGDLVGLPGGLIGGGHVQDTVGVDIEGDLNLRYTTGCWGNTRELEFAQQVVVLCSGTFTFEHLDQDARLVVGVCGEDFALLGRDSGVSLDQRSEDTSSGLDTHGQRCDIEQKKVLGLLGSITGEDGGLDCGTVGYSLIRVDGFVGFLAEKGKQARS